MNIASHKKTILILIATLLVFFGYWFFFLSKKDVQVQNTGNVVSQTPASSNTQYDKEFVSSLLGLNSVDLDVKIFQSRAYIALSYPEVPFVVNYSRESGRNNPFLPIGQESGATSKVNTQTKTETAATTTINTVPPASTSTATTTPKPTPKKF